MKKFLFICASIIGFSISNADQSITVVGGNNVSAPPIAIVNFSNDTPSVNNVANIINNDLNITGELKAIVVNNNNQIESRVNYILTGSINGNTINYALRLNTESKSIVLTNTISNFNKNIRLGAHTISNQIYQKLTNTPGIFTSKIGYIARDKNLYRLIISDYDGYNSKEVVSTKNILASLAWSSDGSQIAYVAFDSKPTVYVQNIYKGTRYRVANFDGTNSSPTFTANGNQLIVTLSKDSNGSKLYLVNNSAFSNRSMARPILNNFSSISTEADIGKNNTLVFTSDHDGGPQIFMSDAMGMMRPKRLTFNLGNYNTTAKLSHDLSKITFIHRSYGTLRTYVENLATGSSYPVSMGTSLDISPSFSPNDKLILFSSNNAMYITNVNGTTQTQLNNIRYNQIIDQRWSNTFK